MNENENILRESGYNPPLTNYSLGPMDKIGFPSKYIRTVATFNEKYHLRDICLNRAPRHNIIYSLEASDLINYIINRVNIWGPVATIFFKLAIVNIVSVIEAIILEAANNICCNANICGKTKNCYYHFSKDERNNARKAIKKLVLIGILDFDIDKLTRVQEIIDLRNRIHIRLARGNEMTLDDYTLALYNEVIGYLQDIDKQIYEKAVPRYRCNSQE